MSLTLEIECLTGACRAAIQKASPVPDWPLQPDRVFSALTAAWAGRGEEADERHALEWLERQSAPTVQASGMTARIAPSVYVPVNDTERSGQPDKYLGVVPDRRPRRERRFPTATPADPTMRLRWKATPEPGVLERLERITAEVGAIGHPSNLVRCRFHIDRDKKNGQRETAALRGLYAGRLNDLEHAYGQNPDRPVIEPGPTVRWKPPTGENEWTAEWLVLELVDRTAKPAPDLLASAGACERIRLTLMSGYRRINMDDRIPGQVSGHDEHGNVLHGSHVAVVPMPYVGSPNADGRVFGYAVVPPAGTDLHRIPGFLHAYEAVTKYNEGTGRRDMTIDGPPLRHPIVLAACANAVVRSLTPARYCRKADTWATITPLVLERHLKRRTADELRDRIADACEHAGLPRPKRENVLPGTMAAHAGVPPVRPQAGEPPWRHWWRPRALGSRMLTHAIIRFGEAVRGPVLVGAGRYRGLGLCLPLEDTP